MIAAGRPMQLLGPGVVVHQSLSKADGGIKRPAYTCSTISLCVAATAAPVRLQEHEVLRWHHSTGRIRSQRVEEVHTELEAVSRMHNVSGFARQSSGTARCSCSGWSRSWWMSSLVRLPGTNIHRRNTHRPNRIEWVMGREWWISKQVSKQRVNNKQCS